MISDNRIVGIVRRAAFEKLDVVKVEAARVDRMIESKGVWEEKISTATGTKTTRGLKAFKL